jgi:hypothetical protein
MSSSNTNNNQQSPTMIKRPIIPCPITIQPIEQQLIPFPLDEQPIIQQPPTLIPIQHPPHRPRGWCGTPVPTITTQPIEPIQPHPIHPRFHPQFDELHDNVSGNQPQEPIVCHLTPCKQLQPFQCQFRPPQQQHQDFELIASKEQQPALIKKDQMFTISSIESQSIEPQCQDLRTTHPHLYNKEFMAECQKKGIVVPHQQYTIGDALLIAAESINNDEDGNGSIVNEFILQEIIQDEQNQQSNQLQQIQIEIPIINIEDDHTDLNIKLSTTTIDITLPPQTPPTSLSLFVEII